MRRSSAALLGMLLACGAVAVAAGLGGTGALALAALGLVGFSTLGTLRTGRAVPDVAWGAPPGPFVFTAAAPQGRGRGGVPAALGRVESRLVPASLAFWVGIGLAALSVWLFGWEWAPGHGGDIGRIAELGPWLVHPLVGMLLVAAHRARSRAHRDGTAELFASCPATEHQRDIAHLATAWVGAVAAIAVASGLLVAYRARAEIVWGPFGGRQLALVAGGGVLAAGATALGVLLGRWAPWSAIPVVVLVAIGLLSLQLPAWGGGEASGPAQLSTTPIIQGFDWLDSAFTAPRWVAHQVWLATLVLVVVALVLWLGTRRRGGALVLGAAVVAAASAGWAATRPMAAEDVERIVSMISAPEGHQTCFDLGVPLCVYRGNEALVAGYEPHVAAVLGALPPGARVTGLTFRQGADVRLSDLPGAVAARLAGWHPGPGVAPVKLSTAGYDAARFWLALAATGLRDEAARGRVVDVAGQARGVVAIWLATRAVPVGRALTEMASLPRAGDDELEHTSWPWPDPCGAGPTPVQWAASDLAAARRLIALPDDVVRPVVHAEWARWLDPSTTTTELLEALALAPVGEDAARTPVVGRC